MTPFSPDTPPDVVTRPAAETSPAAETEPRAAGGLAARVDASICADAADLVALRHDLHRIPEPGLDLPQTLERILREFQDLSLEIHPAREVSGFAAVLRGGGAPTEPSEPRPLVLLRADMDGLPVVEETGVEWAASNGAMHACGHDLHMAGLVGAARALAAVREELPGDVLFFLQPGEEGWDGARHMIEDGLLEAAGRLPDHTYGAHVWSAQFPTGSVAAKPGAMLASSDVLVVTVRGRGGHGSTPHQSLDPVPIAAEMVTQTHVVVTREFDVFDPVVVTCGSVRAGEAPNVIPETATAQFTLRAFSTEARQRLIAVLPRLFEGIAAAHGAECIVEHRELYPVTLNAPEEVRYLRDLVEREMPGTWLEMEHPVTPSEDFSRILQRIPGAFFFVSAVPEGVDAEHAPFNHSPQAVYDDAAVATSARLLAAAALGRLQGGA